MSPRWIGQGMSRRAFLMGGTSMIALPWLPSLRGAVATEAPPVALVWWFVPNGMHMPDFTPTSLGAGFELPRILAPLSGVRDEVSVISGMANMVADGITGGHSRGTAAFLTSRRAEFDYTYCGESADQIAARTIGTQTRLSSLQLAANDWSPVGRCEVGYPCVYANTISWADAVSPLPVQAKPAAVFDRLFGGADAGLSEGERRKRLKLRSSVLDGVVQEVKAIRGTLDAGDRTRMDQFLTGLREVETRLPRQGLCEAPPRPDSPEELEERVDLLSELTALALSCGLTRVVTFMLGSGGSNRSFDFIGAPGSHHDYSHHLNQPENFEALVTIARWEMERFAHLLRAMRGTETAAGPLLDHALVMLGSEMSDGDAHAMDSLPILLAGRGGGAATPGRHLVYEGQPMADLHITMLQAAGVQRRTLGAEGTGPISGL